MYLECPTRQLVWIDCVLKEFFGVLNFLLKVTLNGVTWNRNVLVDCVRSVLEASTAGCRLKLLRVSGHQNPGGEPASDGRREATPCSPFCPLRTLLLVRAVRTKAECPRMRRGCCFINIYRRAVICRIFSMCRILLTFLNSFGRFIDGI